MRKLIAFFTAVILILCFFSFGCGRASLEDYRNTGFSAEIGWERGGVMLRGTLTVGEKYESEGQATRDMRLVLSSPENMRGLEVLRTNGNICLLLDGAELSSGGADGLLCGAYLLTMGGSIRIIRGEHGKESGLYCAVIEGESGSAELILDENGYPRTVKNEEITVVVERFFVLP